MTDASRKVLFFQHSGNNGGAPRSLYQIVDAYEREFGPQTVLFVRKGPVLNTYSAIKSRILAGKRLTPFHGSEVSGMSLKLALRNLMGLAAVPGGYFKYLRGYDVVYLNSSALCFYGMMVRLFSPGTRIVCHIREPLLDGAWGAVIRSVLRRSADHCIAISRNELSNLRLPDISSEVVYNYVHSTDYAPERGRSLHRKDVKVGPDKFVAGYFARLDVKNGLGDFLEIARRHEHDPQMAFCIYGHTGDETPDVKALLAAAGPNVHVYPMVLDVPSNLADLDVLVVPFKKPHFSRSVVEAAMLAVPSVIYDIVSVNETVKDDETGYVVPLNDVAALSARIAQLKSDPERRAQLAAAAREFAMESFSERNYARIREAINA
ncbi:glycosyltransferase family 4 protein [Novosphingobium resinovorum]|uniref:glycosyltransferase family 4 protein n=1 Tax=Novosphingobium resinovorum TaxID=158500 RepID=UPI002ED2ACB2|nr:glycosyltransferase family 4 protein [Novosphingobium resinovorum]